MEISGDDVRRDFVFETPEPVAQKQLALLQPLNLKLVNRPDGEQRVYSGFQIMVL